jgi:hypothetical protein
MRKLAIGVVVVLLVGGGIYLGWYLGRSSAPNASESKPSASAAVSSTGTTDPSATALHQCEHLKQQLSAVIDDVRQAVADAKEGLAGNDTQKVDALTGLAGTMSVQQVRLEELSRSSVSPPDLSLSLALAQHAATATKEGAQAGAVAIASGGQTEGASAKLGEGEKLWDEASNELDGVTC